MTIGRFATGFAFGACIAAIAAPAAAQARSFHIPPGDMKTALETYARQSGEQVVYRLDHLGSAQSPGVNGVMTAKAALKALLSGTALQERRDSSGAIAIVPVDRPRLQRIAAFYQQPEVIPAPPTRASETDTGDFDSEIVVTARKREETFISVPVTLTVVTGRELEIQAVNNFESISRLVPQLVTGEGGGITGGNIAIRGLSGGDSNVFGEQAVTFNFDGVQVAHAPARRMSEMDVAQIEVLKGPQTLFFGRNSFGGIISIRTADPTATLTGKASIGHEFRADEWRGEAYVSGPLSDTLGIRVAGYFSDMKGWFTNIAPDTGPFAPKYDRVPNSTDYAIRGTAKWDPSPNVSGKLKFTFASDETSGLQSTSQLIHCPYGAPQNGDADDCRIDGKMTRSDSGPNFGKFDSRFGNGVPKYKQEQILASASFDINLSDKFTLTSVSGLYDLTATSNENFTNTAIPARILASWGRFGLNQLSQELRLSSEFDGIFDFVTGAHYQRMKADYEAVLYLNGLSPTRLNDSFLEMKGVAYSVFGQAILRPLEVLEVTAGGRYSYERKRLGDVIRFGAPVPATAPRKDSWTNFSPEITASYRPSDDLTAYVSYKEGFLSGGFNAGVGSLAGDLRYNQQTISGFEGGIKSVFANRKLRVNFGAYKYDIKGLQVTNLTVENGIPRQTVTNAGKVGIKGLEADFRYATPLEGLTIRGAVAYNRARYKLYTAPCYRGQSQAQGCNVGINANGIGTLQDLEGATLPRAPEWSGNLGVDYESLITSGMKLRVFAGTNFSSSYRGDSKGWPLDRQKSYQLVNGTLELSSSDDQWSVALIGRNLTNKYYFSRATEIALGGTAGGGIQPGTQADAIAVLSRGREIMLRLAIAFGR